MNFQSEAIGNIGFVSPPIMAVDSWVATCLPPALYLKTTFYRYVDLPIPLLTIVALILLQTSDGLNSHWGEDIQSLFHE